MAGNTHSGASYHDDCSGANHHDDCSGANHHDDYSGANHHDGCAAGRRCSDTTGRFASSCANSRHPNLHRLDH